MAQQKYMVKIYEQPREYEITASSKDEAINKIVSYEGYEYEDILKIKAKKA